MSRTLAILLDADRVRVLSTSTPDVVRAEAPFDPAAPDVAAALLRPALSQGAPAVLVVGLALVEIAQPELPPLSPRQRRALLLRDADRYFPLGDAVAVSWGDGFACATDAARLSRWVDAFAANCTIGAVATVVECLAAASADGSWELPAGAGESGRVRIRGGAVQDVRRAPDAGAALTTQRHGEPHDRAVDLAAIARGADRMLDAPIDRMLLDDALARRVAGARRTRWARGVAVLLLAATAMGWAADRRRSRQLDAADVRVRELSAAAEPAQRDEARLARARAERALLDATAQQEPALVLERLGALLPRDAFIQRLDWDGSVWRIDGSATSAPRIVPLLDADARLTDVRIVAASTRFLDAGVQRESFSISFRSTLPQEPHVAR